LNFLNALQASRAKTAGASDSIACWAYALPEGFSPTVSLRLESGKDAARTASFNFTLPDVALYEILDCDLTLMLESCVFLSFLFSIYR
jgi:hypothetical protein